MGEILRRMHRVHRISERLTGLVVRRSPSLFTSALFAQRLQF